MGCEKGGFDRPHSPYFPVNSIFVLIYLVIKVVILTTILASVKSFQICTVFMSCVFHLKN
jgi:hypothetical protein